MTHHQASRPAPAQAPWTIARIQNTLTNQVLIRRFLLDLTHAPAHEVMNVFTAWQRVAVTIEAARTSPTEADDSPPRSE